MRSFHVLSAIAASGIVVSGQNVDSTYNDAISSAATDPSATSSIDLEATASSILAIMDARKPRTVEIASSSNTLPASEATSTSNSISTATATDAGTATITITTIPTSVSTPVTTSASATSSQDSSLGDQPSANVLPRRAEMKKRMLRRNAKRGAVCSPQNIQYGYTPANNTAYGFLTDPNLAKLASGAPSTITGYTRNFASQFGSVQSDGYLGYYQLASFSPQACGSICDGVDACKFFNIYLERDPLQDPDPQQCPNPAAAVAVVCTLWSKVAVASQATNLGQWRSDFLVVVTGSTGYVKNTTPGIKYGAAPTIPGFNPPVALSGVATARILPGSTKVVLVNTSYADGAFDPVSCAATCRAMSTKNKNTAIAALSYYYAPCNFFDAAVMISPTGTQGTYCTYYSTANASNYATTTTQTSSTGVRSTFVNSYGYALTVPLTGAIQNPLACSGWGDATMLDKTGQNFTLACRQDLDFGFADISKKAPMSFASCVQSCYSVPGCGAVVHSDMYATCWYKNLTSGRANVLTRSNDRDAAYIASRLPAPLISR